MSTMAPTSTAVLFPAVVAALMAMALQLSAAAAPAPPPIGKPGCNTTCGDVSVPYPFGFGPSHCYWEGLNLTCDTSHDGGTPRLLLGDGSLRVTGINVSDTEPTIRVVRAGFLINSTAGGRWNAPFGRGFTEHGYLLSGDNELVVFGCNVVATLLVDGIEAAKTNNTAGRIGGCTSLCAKRFDGFGQFFIDTWDVDDVPGDVDCSDGMSGCCRSPVTMPAPPREVQAMRLHSGSDTAEEMQLPVNVFVAEKGWIDELHNMSMRADEVREVPFVLKWSVTHGLPPGPELDDGSICTDEVHRMLCKSNNSICWNANPGPGYTCQCEVGYEGNPYLAGAGGCKDINECTTFSSEQNRCFGECINTIGSIYCRCPHGTYGNPGVKDGCAKIDPTTDDVLLPTVDPQPIALPNNCNDTCGDVRVPYPLGFGPSRCYWPGLNLTCDTSHGGPPRLLLDSNGTLQVIGVSLSDSTLRVVHHTRITPDDVVFNYSVNLPRVNGHKVITSDVSFQLPHIGESYMLSARNEFVFLGNDMRATLYGHKYRNGSGGAYNNITGCVSSFNSGTFDEYRNCSVRDSCASSVISGPEYRNCSGRDGCCHAPIFPGSTPKKMEFKIGSIYSSWAFMPLAFVSEEGLTAHWWHTTLNSTSDWGNHYFSSPLVLQWAVKQGFQVPAGNSSGKCPEDVASRLCRSKLSMCLQENGGYTCYCNNGYQGNPYIFDGCKDIDECKITPQRCFGHHCHNMAGTYKCTCRLGTFGDANKPDGCVSLSSALSKFAKENKIALSAASGPVLLLLGLGIILVRRKIEQHKMKVLKQKYFKQNHGQLLQQLMSHRADIAERMIIQLDELAKATNNFDKARELGGGGHGTVYKGILSDLHVVAIKKSKITVQNEINEFINEVAILSQVNHKNVVKLFGCCLETEVPLLVYEFISNGTLYDHLHVEGPRSLSWANRLRIATEIATSLAYLHSAVSIPIIHRDIKSSNVLLDDTLTAKVSDFGASRYIPVDKTGLTTRVQGTIGYLDPMYFQTNRLTEKSDVYSFGVILVELLTRKKPFSYLSPKADGLVSHFLDLHVEGNLIQIIDPQVIEEGGEEVEEVAALAASCINLLRGDERPTMRQVEHTLEGIRGSRMPENHGMVVANMENDSVEFSCPLSTKEGQRFEESSRRYSLEQEMMMSARYPR
nr:unnamed protein product [Digitaria exilis]